MSPPGRVRRGLTVGLASLSLLLGACSTLVKPPGDATSETAGTAGTARDGAAAPSLAQAKAGYARVLQKHVNAHGEVAFAALRDDATQSGLPALEAYVRAIAVTPLDAAPTQDLRLAHMINAYNALSMYNVIALGIPESHDGLAKLRFFFFREFEIGGKRRSLYRFESDVIRKLDEPRIHFALNCSAVSCPVLPRRPFTGEALDAELDREARAFFARPANLRIDDAERTVYLSEIMKFYTKDFVPPHAPNLIAYVQRYVDRPIPPGFAVAFTPYDWTIANSGRPR